MADRKVVRKWRGTRTDRPTYVQMALLHIFDYLATPTQESVLDAVDFVRRRSAITRKTLENQLAILRELSEGEVSERLEELELEYSLFLTNQDKVNEYLVAAERKLFMEQE